MPVPPRRPRQRLKRSISQAIFLFFGAPGERRSGRSGWRGARTHNKNAIHHGGCAAVRLSHDKSVCYVCINCMQSDVQRDLPMELSCRGAWPAHPCFLGTIWAMTQSSRKGDGPAGQARGSTSICSLQPAAFALDHVEDVGSLKALTSRFSPPGSRSASPSRSWSRYACGRPSAWRRARQCRTGRARARRCG